MTGSKLFRTQVDIKGKRYGRTEPIALALEAWEQSVLAKQSDAQQAAYLFEAFKACNRWLRYKDFKKAQRGQDGKHTDARRTVIKRVRGEILEELGKYPIVGQALGRFENNKAYPPAAAVNAALAPAKDVYAHEKALYDKEYSKNLELADKLKAHGQFYDYHDPAKPFARQAPSASILGQWYKDGGSFGDPAIVRNKLGIKNKKSFDDLTFNEFDKLDKLFERQYKVFYLGKLQRLRCLVFIQRDGTFAWGTDDAEMDCGSADSVRDQLTGPSTKQWFYAIDEYGNLFVTSYTHQGLTNLARVSVNHTTMCAGNPVLSAGTISIKKGILKGVTNLSGHYKPDTQNLQKAVRLFGDANVDLRDAIVFDKSVGGGTWFPAIPFYRGDFTQPFQAGDARLQALQQAK